MITNTICAGFAFIHYIHGLLWDLILKGITHYIICYFVIIKHIVSNSHEFQFLINPSILVIKWLLK